MHPDNPFQTPYDFEKLTPFLPYEFSRLRDSANSKSHLPWHDPNFIHAFNHALLKERYGINHWDLPLNSLCPAVPGRMDYLFHLRDLLPPKRVKKTRILDIGTGASVIYPILGSAEFGWNFIGTDIHKRSLANAQTILDANSDLKNRIELRHQSDPNRTLNGILSVEEKFDALICNPLFYESVEQAHSSYEKRQSKTERTIGNSISSTRTFSGSLHELVTKGGELEFLSLLIEESLTHAPQISFFSTLVSRKTNLPMLESKLRTLGVPHQQVIQLRHGNKTRHLLMWSF